MQELGGCKKWTIGLYTGTTPKKNYPNKVGTILLAIYMAKDHMWQRCHNFVSLLEVCFNPSVLDACTIYKCNTCWNANNEYNRLRIERDKLFS